MDDALWTTDGRAHVTIVVHSRPSVFHWCTQKERIESKQRKHCKPTATARIALALWTRHGTHAAAARDDHGMTIVPLYCVDATKQ